MGTSRDTNEQRQVVDGFSQKKLELELKYKYKLQLQAASAQQPQMTRSQGHTHSAANIYPTAPQTSFQQPDFSPFSGHQDTSGFSYSDYYSYSSQASSSSRWQPNVASSSNQGSLLSSPSFPLASDDTSKSEGLTFTEQLNSNDDNIY